MWVPIPSWKYNQSALLFYLAASPVVLHDYFPKHFLQLSHCSEIALASPFCLIFICSLFFSVTFLDSFPEIGLEGHLRQSFILVHFPAVVSKTMVGRNTESQQAALTSTYTTSKALRSAKEPNPLFLAYNY